MKSQLDWNAVLECVQWYREVLLDNPEHLILLGLLCLLLGFLIGSTAGRRRSRRQRQTIVSAEEVPAEPPAEPDSRSGSSSRPSEPAASAFQPSTSPGSKGFEVWTMIGIVRFQSTHAAGRFGDWLTAIYYTRKGYTKLRSKRNSLHGIDGIYVKRRPRVANSHTILIVENKINSGQLQPDQLSISGIRRRCKDLLMVADQELHATADLVLKALDGRSADKPVRLLITHDLESGVSTRHHVDDEGRKAQKQGQWRNHGTVQKSLAAKLRKGEITRVDKAGS